MTEDVEKTPEKIVADLRDWVKISDLLEILQISDSTLYRWISEEGFPAGTKWAPKMVRWRLSQVNAWVEARAEACKAERTAA